MPAYELTGTVKLVMDPMTFASGFTKREFVVTTDDDRYPQSIKFECVKDRCAMLDEVQPGQRVTVSFDIRGNENKGRYFVSLSAWKIAAQEAHPDNDVVGEDPPPARKLAPALEDPEPF